MSTPTVSPEPVQKEFSWKRLFIKAAGFGAGSVFVLLLFLGYIWWYESRPHAPRPWNRTAIEARYAELDIGRRENGIIATFSYSLQNNTDTDYQMPASTRIMQKNKAGQLEEITIELPSQDVFVPAHHTVKYSFIVKAGDVFDAIQAKNNDSKMIEIAGKYLKGVDGFVGFDETNRYEIEMPSGWGNLKQ
jgi:hypothetical protein